MYINGLIWTLVCLQLKENTIAYTGANVWNALPEELKCENPLKLSRTNYNHSISLIRALDSKRYVCLKATVI